MKGRLNGLVALSMVAVAVACAENSARAQLEGEYQIQPLYTRYAETVKKITFNATMHVFTDVQLQEADHFDGWTVDADLTFRIPYTKHLQMRIFWPFYTEGDARVIDPGRDYHRDTQIRGYGGVFDFANVELDYQFLEETNHGFNMSAYLGAGERQRILWTDGTHGDVYNHAGQVALFGVRADWHYSENWRFVANAGARYYFKSDDLNPEGTGSSDKFYLADISFAAIYHAWDFPIFPVAELAYQGTFSDYHSVLAVPEVIWAVCPNFEIKAGAPIGLTRDGEQFGGRFQATVRF
jgi:hypothetical protein